MLHSQHQSSLCATTSFKIKKTLLISKISYHWLNLTQLWTLATKSSRTWKITWSDNSSISLSHAIKAIFRTIFTISKQKCRLRCFSSTRFSISYKITTKLWKQLKSWPMSFLKKQIILEIHGIYHKRAHFNLSIHFNLIMTAVWVKMTMRALASSIRALTKYLPLIKRKLRRQ